MTKLFRLTRPSELDLEFEGTVLADVTSRDNEQQTNWTEIRIYKSVSDRFVTEVIGRSIVPGQNDRVTVTVINEPTQVATALQRTLNGRTFLTALALEALDEASAVDNRIKVTQTI